MLTYGSDTQYTNRYGLPAYAYITLKSHAFHITGLQRVIQKYSKRQQRLWLNERQTVTIFYSLVDRRDAM